MQPVDVSEFITQMNSLISDASFIYFLIDYLAVAKPTRSLPKNKRNFNNEKFYLDDKMKRLGVTVRGYQGHNWGAVS